MNPALEEADSRLAGRKGKNTDYKKPSGYIAQASIGFTFVVLIRDV
jgi:hypothetical protein